MKLPTTHYKLLTPFLLLAVSLGLLLLILNTPLAGIFYQNVLAHSFVLLAFTGALFFICFFCYQNYTKEKDIRWYVLTLVCFIMMVFYAIHSVLVPSFGWGNEELFDIFEHYGLFFGSLVLWGLVIPFSDTIKEKVYVARTKIFLGMNFLLLAGFALLLIVPTFANTLFESVNIFIGLTGVSFFILTLVLLTSKEQNFFTLFFPMLPALGVAICIVPFFYQEWNLLWWLEHLLLLFGALLLLLLLRAKKNSSITEILFSSFSIRARLFSIVGLTLVAIVINGLIDFRLSQNHLKNQTLDNLVLVADLQEAQVLGWLQEIKNRIEDFSSDGFIRTELANILSGDQQAVSDLSRHLFENKQPLDPAIFGIHVMDLNGKVVASSRGVEVGTEDMAMDEVFMQAKGARYAGAYVSDIMEDTHFGEKNIAILATAPIIDQAKQENIGVIMLFFKSQTISDILSGHRQAEQGALSTWTARKKTMEMYLVNQDGVMITDSKFIVNAALRQKVDTVPVPLCKKSEEMAGEYLDYRQIPVFGASMCFANGWTLLAEIDTDEVLASLGDYFQQNVLSASATFLFILILLYLFTIGISTPLRELSGMAQKLGKGDFTVRATLATRDEFGELSRVFNQMAENIEKGNASLEEKTKEEQTGRLAIGNILGDLEVAKNQLEEGKAKDEAILASIGDAVMACDKDGRVMLFNGVAQALTGFSSGEVIDNHYHNILHFIKESDEKPSTDFIAEAMATGKGTKMANHTLLITKDGRKIPVADSAAPVKNIKGGIIGCVMVFRDVTYERAVDRAKTEFVSLASHQLRTPLGIIKWYLEALRAEKTYTGLPDRLKEYVETAHAQNARLIELVRDMLDVSRIEKGTAINEPVILDPLALLKDVIQELQIEAQKKKITIDLKTGSEPCSLKVDKKKLYDVFSNLLINALKYNKDKGKVRIVYTVQKQGVVVEFTDTGVGIPKEDQHSIFGKFFRARNAVLSNTTGSGLGLYAVKSYIEQWGGRVSFTSALGKGSTFVVTIPLNINYQS